jgi:opacity protein-like surface antigen
MSDMRIKIIVSAVFAALCFAPGARANWEYGARGGHYEDDGNRITFAARGGMAFGTAKLNNDLGTLVPEPYWFNESIGVVTETYCGGATACIAAGFENVGQIDIGDLPANKKFGSLSFAGGVALGWTLPGAPQWRIEAAWDHISQTDYNAMPMFKGELVSTNKYLLGLESSGVQSKVSTDVVSAFIYYDFFEGLRKQLREFIPYVGFGAGYADSTTVLNLTDLFGDLSDQASMQDFGESTGGAALSFYTSETSAQNISLSGGLGFSYGLDENIFLDAGIRLMWIPKIQWAVNNENSGSESGFKSKDIFSAHNVIYTTATLGIRFEF